MLPVLIYEQNEDMRKRLLDAFDELAPNYLSIVKISISTGSFDSMKRALESENGISLVILGISHCSENNCERCAMLGQIAMQHNRDNYTLYCVHSPEDLSVLLQNCMRPAGILVSPFQDKQIINALSRILDDYHALNAEDTSDDFLTITNDASTYRIPYNQILYMEALDKKINIYTKRQCITVRKSLSGIADHLPAQFVRCHRAYVVNSDFIGEVNFADMSLLLRNNECLPISRSQRTAIKQIVDRRAEA